jgi:hypothetical protein
MFNIFFDIHISHCGSGAAKTRAITNTPTNATTRTNGSDRQSAVVTGASDSY